MAPAAADAFCGTIPPGIAKEISVHHNLIAGRNLFSLALGFFHPRPRLDGASYRLPEKCALPASGTSTACLQLASACQHDYRAGGIDDQLQPVVTIC